MLDSFDMACKVCGSEELPPPFFHMQSSAEKEGYHFVTVTLTCQVCEHSVDAKLHAQCVWKLLRLSHPRQNLYSASSYPRKVIRPSIWKDWAITDDIDAETAVHRWHRLEGAIAGSFPSWASDLDDSKENDAVRALRGRQGLWPIALAMAWTEPSVVVYWRDVLKRMLIEALLLSSKQG
jgi:hypothetical protein